MGNLNIVVVRFILLTCGLFVMVCVFHPLIRSSLFPLHINIRLQNHNCQHMLIHYGPTCSLDCTLQKMPEFWRKLKISNHNCSTVVTYRFKTVSK